MTADFATILAADIVRKEARKRALNERTPAATQASNEATADFVDLVDSLSMTEVLEYQAYRRKHL